ncbi:helix-turn-helix domain-containing protein [Streptomyces monticola]|uniref:Helix-turn-helix domain-containing protein n=1 Tax=Streptomyces monticola TaxID=2666263 RepID=A0ABW2JEW4_9ACTN
MSGASGGGAADEFATLLRELKDRSGLSYGALAKRLHMSTSTLHRYCNGTAVPNDYAPAERLARLCRATPDELVELHRRWILADASRGRRAEQAAAAGAGPGTAEATAAPPDSHPAPDTGTDSAPTTAAHPPHEETEPVHVDEPRTPAPPRRRRTALIASIAVAAVLGATALVVNPPSGWGGGGTGDQQSADAGAGARAEDGGKGAEESSASDAPSAGGNSRKPSASASNSPAGPGKGGPGTSKGGGEQGAGEVTGDGAGVPLNVATRPYVYESPCSQHFLVDSAPEQVGPPANEQDAPRWADAYGAVSSGEQRVALTVQGDGRDTVVLEALHIRVMGKAAPLAWNDYSMGVGCGGNVGTKSFDVDLDDGSPTVTVKNGQRDFPYKVSESDPEVFYVTAHTRAHDVRWELSLDWSSGSRHGTVRIDNDGTPFRTSADAGRPGFDYPLGGGEWIERQG